MPIYRYRCANCGGLEEHLQKVSDPPVERCKACGGALAKQMTAAAFHLKGGGWYKDLYGSAGKSGDAGAATSGGDSGSTSAGASESSSSSSAPSTPTSTPASSTPAPSTPSSSSSGGSSGGSSTSTSSAA